LMVQTKIFDQYKRRNEYRGIRPASIIGSILILEPACIMEDFAGALKALRWRE
jgi:hypothetical protein